MKQPYRFHCFILALVAAIFFTPSPGPVVDLPEEISLVDSSDILRAHVAHGSITIYFDNLKNR